MAQCRLHGELLPVALLHQSERYASLVSCANSSRTMLITRLTDVRTHSQGGWLSIARVLQSSDGRFGAPVLWAERSLHVAHNAAWLCMGDKMAGDEMFVGYGGRDRSNAASASSSEVGVSRVAVPVSSALLLHGIAMRAATTAPHATVHDGELDERGWQAALRQADPRLLWRRELQFNGSHPGCDERRDFWGPVCEFDGRLSVVVHRPTGRVLLYARANTRRLGNGRHVQVTSSADGRSNWGRFEHIRFACGRPVEQPAPQTRAYESTFRTKGLTRAKLAPKYAGGRVDVNGIDFGSWRIIDIYFVAVDWHEELGWLTSLMPITYQRRGDAAVHGGIFVAHSKDGVVWTSPRRLLGSSVFLDVHGTQRTADHPIATRYSAASERLYAYVQHNTSVMLDDAAVQLAEGGALKRRIRPFICRYPLPKPLMPPTVTPMDRGSGPVDSGCKRVPCCSAPRPEVSGPRLKPSRVIALQGFMRPD